MAPTEFHAALGTVGIAQQRVAQLFGVGPRSVRRWQYGDRRVPCGVGIVFRLLADGVVTVEQVERAANPIRARTNGAAEPEPPAPLDLRPPSESSTNLAEPPIWGSGGEVPTPISQHGDFLAPEPSTDLAKPPSEPSAPLPVQGVTEATVSDEPVGLPEETAPAPAPVTTAEKVAALTSGVCHWPIGDPQHPDFRFCGSPVTAPPYCEEHRGVAYLVPPPFWVRRRGPRLYTSTPGIGWAG
jgi:hypothetical protein